MKLNLMDFDNFRVSNKYTLIVELDPNFAFNLAFRSLASTSTTTAAAATSIASKPVNSLKYK